MEVHDKIKILRQSKNWSQGEVADKLGISLTQYGNIERGETKDLRISRLKKIAELFGVELSELFSLNEKSIINLIYELNQSNNHWNHGISTNKNENLELKYELEKSQLIIEQQVKEITLMQQQINDLRSMLVFLKDK